MQIEKRLPFGFRGDWGKLYKRYTADEEVKVDHEVIKIQENYYVDIGQNVQFKRVGEITEVVEQPKSGLMVKTLYATIETTDSYWDNNFKEYFCVVLPDDIIRLFNRQWVATSIRTVSKYTPSEQKFFYIDIRSLS